METDDLARQLARLLRGRGLRAPSIVGHIGPGLRDACGVNEADNSTEVRIKVTACIRSQAAILPEDLRLAVLAALGLHDAAAYPLLKDRLEWIGQRLDREPRTAHRRVDAGLRLLAERLTSNGRAGAENPYAPGGWYTDELRATLRLDLDSPELLEERSIVATRDGLHEVLVSLTAPGVARSPEAPGIRLRMEHDGRILAEKQPARGHYQARIKLPNPLMAGQRQQYAVTFILQSRDAMRPYYLMTPFRPCCRFSASVSFGSQTPPGGVWRLDGLPRGLIGDTPIIGEQHAVDEHGTVSAEFRMLRPGLSYGLQWSMRA